MVEWRISEGLTPYEESLAWMEARVAAILAGEAEECVWLLEHPALYTAGTSARAEDLVEPDRLPVHVAGRGGEYTYHGPGQLVVYPILDLKPDRKDLHGYLRDLETVLIAVAASFDVQAERNDGLTGVWTKTGKLAAIGVRVSSGWITSHGVALNVSTDLEYFATIVPCGIPDRDVTSLERETGRPVSIPEASKSLVECFVDVFSFDIVVA